LTDWNNTEKDKETSPCLRILIIQQIALCIF
jgi:hypothetical protein